MIRDFYRARGASAVGARTDGEAGPFGNRPLEGEEHLDDDDGGGQALDDGGGEGYSPASTPGGQEQPGLDDPRATRDAQLLASVAAAGEQRARSARERFAARRRAAQERREALWRQRQAGLAQRHAAKLRRVDGGGDDDQDDGPPEAA